MIDSTCILHIQQFILCRIEPSLGKIRSLSADSCKHIREVLATDCTNLPNSGVYWVQGVQVHIYHACMVIVSYCL